MSTPLPENDETLGRYVRILRDYLRDHPEVNRLIVGEESSERALAFAVLDALSDFNTSPPITYYSLTTYPKIATNLLLRGAAVSVLESVGLLASRNYLNFQDGGPRLGISDRGPLILSYLQMLSNKYEEKKDRFKRALNIENAWGEGIPSEYSLLWIYGGY